MITDRYGRVIVDHGNGSYSTDGVLVENLTEGEVVAAFDSMAPADWVEPERPPEPLDRIGALATLLAVTETLTVEDAANAVRLMPEALVQEAEAWAIAAEANGVQ